MVKLHKRANVVSKAKLAISQFICEQWDANELTSIEIAHITATLAADFSIYPLRAERHPDDPNRKANEE